MSDLTERLRRIATTPSAYVQSISRDELIEAADRIEQLEAALLRSAVDYNDFNDGSDGYWQCSVCRATALISQPKSKLKHRSDCLVRALEADHE